MKYKIIGIIVSILLVATAFPTVMSRDTGTIKTLPSTSSDLRQAFIFGRYTNLTAQDEFLIIEAVNLLVIYKEPRSFEHFPQGTIVTFEMYTAYGHMFKKVGVLFLHVELVV
jgi:hypothetical protein